MYTPYQQPQNFKDQQTPVVSAAWLNRIDQMMITTALSASAFGVDPTGTSDSTQSLINWATSGQQYLYLPPGNYRYTGALTYAITNNINPSIIRMDGALFADSGMTPGTQGLTISGSNVILLRPQMDGTLSGNTCLANGIKVTGGRVKIIQPTMVHFPTTAIWFAGGPDCFVYDYDIAQLLNGDTPWNGTGGNPGLYFTGEAIRFDATDCSASRGVLRWCKNGVRFTSAAADCWVTNTHFYQGTNPPATSNGPIVDPIGIQVDAGSSSIYIHDNTLDNIHVECYTSSVSIRNNELLQTNHCTFTADVSGNIHMIRVYATQVNDMPRTFSYRGANSYTQAGTLPIGFLPTGANTWAGSFANLDALFSSSTFQEIQVTGGMVWVDGRSDDTWATIAFLKQAGTIFFTYAVGTGTAIQLTLDTPVGGPNIATWLTDTLKIAASTVASATLQLNDTKLYNDGSHNFFVKLNGVDVWQFVSDGVLRPVLDETRNIGGASNRVNKVFLGSGSGAGTECLQVDSSAVTAAKSSDGTVLPIKVDGVVKYIQLCT